MCRREDGGRRARACAVDAPDLVLIDLLSPRGHGFEVCRKLKEQSTTRFVPVVIVTAQADRADRLRASKRVATTSSSSHSIRWRCTRGFSHSSG
jgi:DNA-binding response OmpR family regulator